MKLVLVKWEDSVQPVVTWHHFDDLPALEIAKCESVGLVVAENDQVLMLAANVADNEQCSGIMRIPKSCITEIITIGVTQQ